MISFKSYLITLNDFFLTLEIAFGETANNNLKKKKSFLFIFKPELTSGVTNYQKIFSILNHLTQRCSPGMAGTR